MKKEKTKGKMVNGKRRKVKEKADRKTGQSERTERKAWA